MTESFSFFDYLTNVSGQGFPATEVVKFLIQTVGHDVCAFKRNSLSAYELVHAAGKIYQAINGLIDKIEKGDGDFWDNFRMYTEAMDSLEELLFRFAILAEKESTLSLSDDHREISTCINFIHDWDNAQREIKRFLDELQKFPLAPANGLAITQHDDLNLLSTLCADIKNHQLKDDKTIPIANKGLIHTVGTTAASITPLDRIADESLVLSIKCTMLVHGVMQVSVKSSDAEVKAKLRSAPVWEKAKSLLSNLVSHLKPGPKSSSVQELQKEWDEFVAYLSNKEPAGTSKPLWDVPSEYLELVQSAKNVMRPYHSRASELVSQCFDLVQHFKANRSAKNLELLTTALKVAVHALRIAAKAMTRVEEHSQNIESTDAAKAIADAEDNIKKCFQAYGMTTDWTKHGIEMANALKTDKKFLDDLNTRLKKADTGNPGTGKVKLILIVMQDGKNVATFKTHENTALSAILWKLAQKDNTLLRCRYFEQDTPGRERIGLDKHVGDIKVNGSNRTVHLPTP